MTIETTTRGAAPIPGRSAQLAAAGGLAAAALTYVTVCDPHDRGTAMPRCPFHAVTGLNCPGCGGLRMTHDLLHGHLAAAFADNAVLLLLTPVLLFFVVRAGLRWRSGRPAPEDGRFELNGRAGVALAAIGFTWMLVRNLNGW